MAKILLTEQQRKIGRAWLHDVLVTNGSIYNCRPKGDGLFMQEKDSAEEAQIEALAEFVAEEITTRNFHNIDRTLHELSTYRFNPDLNTPNSECAPEQAGVAQLSEYIADFCASRKLYWDDARRLKDDAQVGDFKMSLLGRRLEEYGCFVSQIAEDVPMSLPDEPFTAAPELAKALNFTLRGAKRKDRSELGLGYEVPNIMLIGPGTTGKVAAIREWAESNVLNLFVLDATKKSIRTDLGGYAALCDDDPQYFTFKYSGALDALDKPNSVLLIPNLIDQFSSGTRHSLCKLAVEGWVAGNDENNRRYFPNLLFTITCVRPTDPSDPFDTELDYDDWCRFANHFDI